MAKEPIVDIANNDRMVTSDAISSAAPRLKFDSSKLGSQLRELVLTLLTWKRL
jgi:hypothetical protein